MKLDKLGWIIAAGMAGAMAMSGFQGQSLKFANCDVGKVFVESNIFKQNSEELNAYEGARTNVLRFLVGNSEMAAQDAKDYADLSLKKNQSDADKQRLEKITSDASGQVQKHRELATKKDPNADELSALQQFTATMTVNNGYVKQLDQQYQNDVKTEGTKLQTEALDKVRKTISDIATKKGYNMVFSTDASPFAENNITEEALKDINKT